MTLPAPNQREVTPQFFGTLPKSVNGANVSGTELRSLSSGMSGAISRRRSARNAVVAPMATYRFFGVSFCVSFCVFGFSAWGPWASRCRSSQFPTIRRTIAVHHAAVSSPDVKRSAIPTSAGRRSTTIARIVSGSADGSSGRVWVQSQPSRSRPTPTQTLRVPSENPTAML